MKTPSQRNEATQQKASMIPLDEEHTRKHDRIHRIITKRIARYKSSRGDPANESYNPVYTINLKVCNTKGIMSEIGQII